MCKILALKLFYIQKYYDNHKASLSTYPNINDYIAVLLLSTFKH